MRRLSVTTFLCAVAIASTGCTSAPRANTSPSRLTGSPQQASVSGLATKAGSPSVSAVPGAQPTGSGVPNESSTPGRSTAGSSAPAALPTTIGVDHQILGISGGYELFARSPGSVASIQFAQGRVTVKPAPAIQSGAGAFFLVGLQAVIARAWDYVPGFLMPDDGPARPLPGALSGGGGQTLPGPAPDQVWVEETSNGTESGVKALQLVGLDGETTSTTIAMHGPPLAPDGKGYVLVRDAGVLYDVHPDERTRIFSGAGGLVAVGPTGWLVHPCSDDAECTDVYIDRATGSRHQIPAEIDPRQWGVISPNGSYAAVFDNTNHLHLIDLATGTDRVVELASGSASWRPSHGAKLAWSPDGRWVFVAAGRIRAVDPATGQLRTLSVVPGSLDFIQVAIRPAHTSGDAS